MDQLTARPKILKQANLSSIRRAIKTLETATRAEIAKETKISSTTVRSLLNEMLTDGEIESMGYDESSGGRKAERYRFKPDRYYSAAFCISDYEMHALLINLCGEITEVVKLQVQGEEYEETIVPFLDDLVAGREIKAIGLGVPGIVEGGGYWKKRLENEEMYKVDIGSRLSKRYHVPVVLENDINATALGFGHCYEREFPEGRPEQTNMAYLHLSEGCISAGFIAGGRVIRGAHNFAGELGLIPVRNEKLLDARLAEPMDDVEYARTITEILSWICAILNPEYIALGGTDLRKESVSAIGSLLSATLPRQMAAEILYSPDVWHDYHSGMAFLTSAKMFDEVQLVKE